MSALDGWIDVCRTGTWRDMSGQEVTLTRRDLDGYVAAHAAGDPAPVVIGHPRHDSPAWAWVESLRRAGDRLQAKLRDVDDSFRDAVEAGRYASRSIAVAGGRVRHLGFLGGRAPAVDGLAPTQFAGEPDLAIEFAAADLAAGPRAWAFRSIARALRGLREHIIEQSDQETADRVIPSWEIDQVAEAADEDDDAAPAMAGAEPTLPTEDPLSGTATGAAAPTEAELAARTTELDEREAALAAREEATSSAAALAAADASLEAHVRAGRVLPAERAGLAALLARLADGDETELRFAATEGGSDVAKKPREILEALLAGLPKRVEFNELAGGDPPAARPAPGFAVPADAQIDRAGLAVHNRAVALAAEREIAYVEAAELAAQGV